jgi:hypothetical protein
MAGSEARVDAISMTRANGLGMGLSLDALRRSRGRLWGTTNETSGADFWMMLPIGKKSLENAYSFCALFFPKKAIATASAPGRTRHSKGWPAISGSPEKLTTWSASSFSHTGQQPTS